MKARPAAASHRLAHIDAMRGLAAISVIVFHCCLLTIQNKIPLSDMERAFSRLTFYWLDLGKVGVIVFFWISGFVIPTSLLKRSSAPRRDFIIGRIFRMYPAYWLSIPLGILAARIYGEPSFSAKTILLNATMMQQFFGADNIIGLYWTLQIEIIFYIICVFIFSVGWLSEDRKVFYVFVGLMLLAIIMAIMRYYTGKSAPVALPLSLSIMFLGFFFRLSKEEESISSGKYLKIGLLLFVSVIPFVCYFAYQSENEIGSSWQRYVFSYYFAILSFFLLTGPLKIRHNAVIYLGKISYSIYLLGAVIQIFLMAALPLIGLQPRLFTMIATTVPVTIAAAAVVYRLVEWPGIAMGRALAEWLDRGRSARPDIDAV